MTYYADDSITLHHGHALSDSNPIEVLGRKVERLAQTDCFDGNLHPPDHVLARARSAERGVSERVGLRSGKVLGRPEKQAVFRLRSLYSQEGEHGEQCFGRDLIGRLPVVERSTLGSEWGIGMRGDGISIGKSIVKCLHICHAQCMNMNAKAQCTCMDPAVACPACLARRDANGWPKSWRERMRTSLCPACGKSGVTVGLDCTLLETSPTVRPHACGVGGPGAGQ